MALICFKLLSVSFKLEWFKNIPMEFVDDFLKEKQFFLSTVFYQFWN